MLLGLRKFLVNRPLLALHFLLLVLEVADINLDGFFLIVQVQSRVSETLNFIDFGVFAELWVEVVIIIVIVFFFDFFFLVLLTVFVTITVLVLDFLGSAALLSDFLVEGQDLVVELMVGIHQVMELRQQLMFFFLDVFDFLTLVDKLARDFLDLLDDESLGLSALLEFVGETDVLRLHRFQQDKLLEEKH